MSYKKVQIGTCTLFCGDAIEVLRTLGDDSVDMIWTDPPYGHGNMDGDLQAARVRDGVKGARVKAADPIKNDRGDDFDRVMVAFLDEAARVMKRDCCCCCCCCCGGGGPSPTFAKVANWIDDRLEFFHAVVWDKSARGNGMGWRYRRNYEFVMVAHRKGGKLLWADNERAVPNIVRHSPVTERSHPNEKPSGMVCDFLKWHTMPEHLILDPFMGSGTTGVACANLGRRFVGVELDQAHFSTACRRIEQAYADRGLLSLMEGAA
jgi:site-specific DNA-methyltransferase (adenine-specific)